eukprot:comp22832_c0_seq1/m.35926 comp22832_c0_seq1/g.35926  ORF comp22832_c0_seq1/g.35926 comp22832_c0_seq1/m.35926 type:complete len:405 (-) comp22832_c0_seq1:855-2069(-)
MEEAVTKRCVNLAGSYHATHALQLCFSGPVPKVDIPLFVFLNGANKAAITFGRGLTDVKVTSASNPLAISNIHARMDYVEAVKVWQLTDLSTNGTRVTNAEGTRHRLDKGKPRLLLRDTVVTFAVADARFKFIDLTAGTTREGWLQRIKELENLASYWLKFPDGPGPATPPMSPVIEVEPSPFLKRSRNSMSQPVSPRDEVTVWEEYIPGYPASEGEARGRKKARVDGGRAVVRSSMEEGRGHVASMVTCGLCCRLLAHAQSLLPCRHLFCAECIDKYDSLCGHEHRCYVCLAPYSSHYVLQPWADAVAEALLSKSNEGMQGETYDEWQVRRQHWEDVQYARCSQGPVVQRNRHRVAMLLRAMDENTSPSTGRSPKGSDDVEVEGSVGRVGRLLARMSTDDVTK